MNTYFQQSLTEVQSQEFASDFKATVRFIFRLIKLLFLLLTAIFNLGRKVYCKVSKQNTEVTLAGLPLTESLTNLPIDQPLADLPVGELIAESSLTESTLDSNPTVEDNLQQEQSEGTLVVTTNKTDSVNRQKELKQMKAAQLRKLCADYSLQYQNKQQAIRTIFQFEWEQIQANLG
jgi:hypothetical protein